MIATSRTGRRRGEPSTGPPPTEVAINPAGPARMIATSVAAAGVRPSVRGHGGGMTTPEQPPSRPGLADVAAEPAEESVRHERELVGDAPDTGDLVPPDSAQ